MNLLFRRNVSPLEESRASTGCSSSKTGPGGTSDNSPALQRRVCSHPGSRAGGTPERPWNPAQFLQQQHRQNPCITSFPSRNANTFFSPDGSVTVVCATSLPLS